MWKEIQLYYRPHTAHNQWQTSLKSIICEFNQEEYVPENEHLCKQLTSSYNFSARYVYIFKTI